MKWAPIPFSRVRVALIREVPGVRKRRHGPHPIYGPIPTAAAPPENNGKRARRSFHTQEVNKLEVSPWLELTLGRNISGTRADDSR